MRFTQDTLGYLLPSLWFSQMIHQFSSLHKLCIWLLVTFPDPFNSAFEMDYDFRLQFHSERPSVDALYSMITVLWKSLYDIRLGSKGRECMRDYDYLFLRHVCFALWYGFNAPPYDRFVINALQFYKSVKSTTAFWTKTYSKGETASKS